MLIVVYEISKSDMILSAQEQEFYQKVINDKRVWLIKFYSPMCSACFEFTNKWSDIETHFKMIKTGSISIDDLNGTKLAKRLGVDVEGVPNIRIFNGLDPKGVSILKGSDYDTSKGNVETIIKNVKHNIKGNNCCLLFFVCFSVYLYVGSFFV